MASLILCSGSRDPQAPAAGGEQLPRRGRGIGHAVADDDFDLDLPDDADADREPKDSTDDDWEPDDESDLGLDGGGEDVGLDTTTGLDDAQDDLDLDDTGEGVSWTADSEAADDLLGTDEDLGQGEEYGWIGEDEPAVDDDAFDVELVEQARSAADDEGAEGMDDESALDDFEVSKLPALDADGEDGVDGVDGADAGAEPFEELSGVTLPEEPMIEVREGVSWKRLPEHSVRITQVGTRRGAQPVAGETTAAPDARVICRSVQLLAEETRVLCVVDGKPARELLAGAEFPAALVDEEDEVFAYVCVPEAERVLLVRVASERCTEPVVVAVLARERYGVPCALSARYVEARVTLKVVTDRATVCVEASLDGETLA